MESLERNVAPQDTQSQWVGEAAIKGKSQVSPSVRQSALFWREMLMSVDDAAHAVDNMSCWIAVYLYHHHPVMAARTNCREC